MKNLLTIVLGDESLEKSLNEMGLGSVFFIKKREDVFKKINDDQRILYLELLDGLNFDLPYFLKYSSSDTIGLFYQENPAVPFFLMDGDFNLLKIETGNSSYFDGFIPCGVYLTNSNHLRDIFKGNYSHLKGISLGKNKDYQDFKNLRQALFLDRDGIINIDLGYVFEPEKAVIYEGVIPLIKAANQKNMPVVILTNQSGIAKGWYKEEDVYRLHRFFEEEISILGGKIDAWFFSPYHPNDGIFDYKKESLLRKPGPGMALLACELFPIDFSTSFMVGDKLSDNLLIPGLQCINLKRGYDLTGTKFPICDSYNEIIDLIFGSNNLQK